MGYSGAGGKLIHEKNQKQKICPFKGAQAWDIRLQVYYTIKAYLSRRLQNWKKKLISSPYWMYFQQKPH